MEIMKPEKNKVLLFHGDSIASFERHRGKQDPSIRRDQCDGVDFRIAGEVIPKNTSLGRRVFDLRILIPSRPNGRLARICNFTRPGLVFNKITAVLTCVGVTWTLAVAGPAVPNSSPGPEYADSVRMFQGIPGIERVANNRLWAAWYGGGIDEDQHNSIFLSTSGDDGRSWQPVLVLDPDGAEPLRAFDPCLWRDPTGKLWLFWSQETYGQYATKEVLAITTTDPDVGAAKWSAPRQICKGVMMNKPTVTADGKWLLPVATWSANGSSRVIASSDNGSTFTELGAANIPDVKRRNYDEHMIVERKDDSLWMLVRTNDGIGESVSIDAGKTWSDVVPSKIQHPVSRFFIRRLASSRLLLVRHNPPNNGKTRSHLTAFLSDDDGRTWKGGLLLDERDWVSYPDGVQSSDGSIRVIYDHQRKTEKEILMAAFTETDVLEGKIISPESRLRVLVNQATGNNPSAMMEPGRNSNADGVAMLTGPAAELECVSGENAVFEKGAKLFSNRDYTATEVPIALSGFQFIRGTIDGVHAVCRQPGIVVVITPSQSRNPDSRVAALLESDFKKTNLSEFLVFPGEPNLCSVYQKQMVAGESVVLGKWAVLLGPKKLMSAPRQKE